MNKPLIALAVGVVCVAELAHAAPDSPALSESDFLADMPVVLSVSRLAQRLDETPGAMTLLDRQFIRMSGARDVADLLRLVPGFQSTNSFETDAPMVTYHGRTNDWANRIQVLVDGRSVYSSYFQGSTGQGLQTLAIDDIERIEILRGSNSAAYGARAFLGVINIVSRDPLDTAGGAASVAAGGNGMGDAGGRIGWGDPSAMYRISADTRGDEGLRGQYGNNRINRVNFSSHFALDAGDDLDIRAGAVNVEAGRGSIDSDSIGNPARKDFMGSRFLQADWRRKISADHDLALTLSHTQSTYRDNFPYLNPNPYLAPYYGITISYDGQARYDVLTLQSTTRHSNELRSVWGVELRQEQIESRALFDDRGQVTTNFERLFGNAEWRVTPTVLLNAGAMLENNDIDGSSVSPRLYLNWQPVEGHTLRAGVTQAFRPPGATEKYGLVRYYDRQGANPLTYAAMSGNVGSEHIQSSELGYYLNLAAYKLSADVRVFHEQIRDGIYCSVDLPYDCTNKDDYSIKGLEYQVQWKPGAATQVFWSQTWTDISGLPVVLPLSSNLQRHQFYVMTAAPSSAGSLAVMHTFASGVSLTLTHNFASDGGAHSGENRGELHATQRTDLRLAKAMQWGRTRGEIALTVQNLDLPYQDGSASFYFDRRAFVTLRLEN